MFNIIIWNVGGVNNLHTLRRLQDLASQHHIKILAILEPMVADNKLPIISKKLSLFNKTNHGGVSRMIWILWDDKVPLQILSETDQCCNVEISSNNKSFLISIIFAKCEANLCKQLLYDLLNFASSSTIPWIVVGFYEVISIDERVGYSTHDCGAIEDFTNFIINLGLHDTGFTVSIFIWSKKISRLHQN